MNIKLTTQKALTSFFTPKSPPLPPPLLPPQEEEDNIFKDIKLSNKDSKFDKLIEEKLRAEDYSIKLDNLNNIEFINSE